MNVDDFDMIAQLLRQRSGLVLSRDKAYLMESRLNPVARRHSFSGFEDLAQVIRLGQDEALLRDVTEAMTTNETCFFRDMRPFDQFRDVILPYLLEQRAETKSFRIWSAACSNGQEPYSLAMILRERAAELSGWHVDIAATDLSSQVIGNAQDGRYSQFEVQRGLPIELLVKYFKQKDERWQIDDGIRRMVAFDGLNLLDDLSRLGRFDVVFCRNVLLYFDQKTRTAVLEKIAGLLAEDGFLFLGASETVLGVCDRFQVVVGHPGMYELVSDAENFMAKAAG